MPEETRKAVLDITECVEGYRGDNDKGEYIIYDIKALSNGSPVQAKLKAFAPVPLGEAEYEMEKYTNKKGEVSWTLKVDRPRGNSGGVGITDFTALANRVTALEQRVGMADSDVTPAGADWLGASAPLEDDDIPF